MNIAKSLKLVKENEMRETIARGIVLGLVIPPRQERERVKGYFSSEHLPLPPINPDVFKRRSRKSKA